jgi:hypothetical protein
VVTSSPAQRIDLEHFGEACVLLVCCVLARLTLCLLGLDPAEVANSKISHEELDKKLERLEKREMDVEE